MKTIAIIPAYNEEKTIAGIVNKVKVLVDKVVVVDDGSIDKTAQFAKEQGAVVLKHLINRGQGAALQTGNEYCLINNAEIIVHFDADGQFLPEEIRDVVRPIENGTADVVLGSRFLKKKSKIPQFKQHIIIPLARLVNKLIGGVDLTDPQSGFRAMSKKVAYKIRIENEGMAHCSEILYKIFKNNLTVKEVPITVIYHNFGQRFSGGIKIVKDLLLAKLIN